MHKDDLLYFALLSKRTDAMVPVGIACSLAHMAECLSLMKVDLCTKNKLVKVHQ